MFHLGGYQESSALLQGEDEEAPVHTLRPVPAKF
jgi:hypothetical protein